MSIEIANFTRLSEVFDAEGPQPVTKDTAQPSKGGGMPIEDSDYSTLSRNNCEQPFDMACSILVSSLARPLGRMPAGIEPIGRGHGEQADVPPILSQ